MLRFSSLNKNSRINSLIFEEGSSKLSEKQRSIDSTKLRNKLTHAYFIKEANTKMQFLEGKSIDGLLSALIQFRALK